MVQLTEDQIKDINSKCPYDQGIFKEANGIPLHIKEPVVYSAYRSGARNGSCWDDENTVNEHYDLNKPDNHMKVLDIVLDVLRPNVSDMEKRMLLDLVESDMNREYGYYGDYDENTVEWIKLSDLYRAIAMMD